MNSRGIAMACVFLAVAITALPADDVVAEALPADMAPETDLYVEQLHKEASDDIASLMEAGKTKDACSTLADSSIKEITDGRQTTQTLVNRMDVGKNCHTAGLAAYNSAKKRETQAKRAYYNAKGAYNRANKAPIKFKRPVTVSMVKTSGCLDVSKDPDYIKAKKATSSASKKATLAQGQWVNAKQAKSNALKAHKKAKVACACRAQKNHKAARKATNNFNSAKNAKAWTKAHHMKCVLSGKPANKCPVPRVPRVTAPSMRSWVARTKCSGGRPASGKPRPASGGTLQCKTTKKTSNSAGITKPKIPGGGYLLVGGGMTNYYRSFNKLSAFEQATPNGNHFQCDMGFGPGRLTCYARYCKKPGMKCSTVQSKRQRSKYAKVVKVPRGYKMTGGGLQNHYGHFDRKALFRKSYPDGQGWMGHMGDGWGDFTISARGCTGLRCQTKYSGKDNSAIVKCPSGYKVTSCGAFQYKGWTKLGAFEQISFQGNGCHCDMGFGIGKMRCYARCCA